MSRKSIWRRRSREPSVLDSIPEDTFEKIVANLWELFLEDDKKESKK